MEDKETYICGIRDEIESRIRAAYNRGHDDGYEEGKRDQGEENEYFVTIGKAFLQWISDKKNIVVRAPHDKESTKRLVYSVLNQIAAGKGFAETFRVGDEVVDNSGVVGIITRIDKNEETADVMVTDEENYGHAASGVKLNKMKRTGRHCDITLNW